MVWTAFTLVPCDASEPPPLRDRTPWLTVLTPVRATAPVPVFVRPPGPLIVPPSVRVLAPLTVLVAVRRLGLVKDWAEPLSWRVPPERVNRPVPRAALLPTIAAPALTVRPP